MLLFMFSSNFHMYSQTVFSVESISKAEFENAKTDFSRHNAAIITPKEYNDTINQVLRDARQRFEKLDSARKIEILEEIGEDFDFNLQQIIYIPDWKVYGFLIPKYHNNEIWWYDSSKGKFLDDAKLAPTSANLNGIYVSQIGFDCDWRLDLHFFGRGDEYFYEFASFSDSRFNGEYLFMPDDGKGIFWGADNTLYILSYDYEKIGECYLKVQFK